MKRQEFLDTMARLASTVCVVASGAPGKWHGRTVTAMMSLSADPPAVLVSITSGSELAQAISETGGFSLAMLAQGQGDIADRFAGKGLPMERFDSGLWEQWPSGRPRLMGAASVMDCTLAGTIDIDTHCLFAGVVIETVSSNAMPLLWHDRRYLAL